jgi:hypothetical protein
VVCAAGVLLEEESLKQTSGVVTKVNAMKIMF